jgi:hypothetical protein
MSLLDHAKYELQFNGFLDKDSDYNGMIGEAVLELIETFSKQGHSGMSAGIVRSIFNELADYKPLGGISGEDNEWKEVSSNLYQNKRLSGVFKDIFKLNGKPYYLDAITWKTSITSTTWSGVAVTKDRKKISSRQFIKDFPFYPKTFQIEVHEVENSVDDSFIISEKGMQQLEEALKYYDFYEIDNEN